MNDPSISFPSNISSVISAIVVELHSAVVEKPIFDSWEGWLTGNISIPVFVNVDFQSIDNASGWIGFIIKFASVDNVSDGISSVDGAVWVSIQWRIVKLGWPGSVCSVVSSVIVQVDRTVVVKPKSDTSKAVGSLGEDIPSFIDSGQQVVVNAFSCVAFRGDLTSINGIVDSIGLIIWASLKHLTVISGLDLVFDFEELFFQNKA